MSAGLTDLEVTVGNGGVGAAMMQMNRAISTDLEVTVGSAGVGAAMMQMNRAISTDLS
ncbi:hypothetical protein [Streptomyces sp. NPDC002952]|uniref:hypothetical protein n=1 Tax=Streptomyces sp. NPDC002952 TaxID=3364673 RepID=UPI0036B2D9DC